MTFVSPYTRVLSLTLLASPLACSDDGLAQAETDAESTGTLETSASTTLTTSGPSGTSADAGTDSAESGSSSGNGENDDTGPTTLEVMAEVTKYAQQPMVVDLDLTLSIPGHVSLSHLTDFGVVVALLEGGDETHLRYRVRGLTPGTDHTLSYSATPTGGGNGIADVIEFTTLDALPGFIAGFELETTDVTPEPLYRMLDINVFPVSETNGLAMIDTAGITRWYLGVENMLVGPASVWAAPKIRPDGSVLYLRGDTLWIRDELAEVLLELPALDMDLPSLHHEAIELDNGNFLAMSMAFQEVDYGPDGVLNVAGDLLVELTPDGEVVWTWNAFDHLDPQRRRADFDATYFDPINAQDGNDWTHGNAMIYDPVADTVLVSLRHQDWIILVDRATGEVLWRLGDEGDFELQGDDRWFFHQHSPQWQPDGSLLLYDNGVGNPFLDDGDEQSHAARYELDFEAMTATLVWRDSEEPFVSVLAGDADLLPGGHYLVADALYVDGDVAHGRLRELAPGGDPERVWSVRTPDDYLIYRASAHTDLVGMATR
jgi:arylsulfotransferase ASST